MKNIDIIVKYFGLIAEITRQEQEVIQLQEGQKTQDLHQKLLKQYPSLKTSVFQIAHNQQLIYSNDPLKHLDEIALLPPFAGG
jgi:molybdopterin converting factor small subunit